MSDLRECPTCGSNLKTTDEAGTLVYVPLNAEHIEREVAAYRSESVWRGQQVEHAVALLASLPVDFAGCVGVYEHARRVVERWPR